MEMCRKTLRSEAKDNPEAYRKRIVDGFDSLGVPPSALVEYLGHPVERSSPAEIESLRLLYGAIKEGETTFDGALQLHRRPDEPDVSPKSAKAKARAILTAAKPSPPDAA
jgi:hypothetical protein